MRADGAPIVTVSGLGKRFGSHQAVDDVSFDVLRGGSLGIGRLITKVPVVVGFSRGGSCEGNLLIVANGVQAHAKVGGGGAGDAEA